MMRESGSLGLDWLTATAEGSARRARSWTTSGRCRTSAGASSLSRLIPSPPRRGPMSRTSSDGLAARRSAISASSWARENGATLMTTVAACACAVAMTAALTSEGGTPRQNRWTSRADTSSSMLANPSRPGASIPLLQFPGPTLSRDSRSFAAAANGTWAAASSDQLENPGGRDGSATGPCAWATPAARTSATIVPETMRSFIPPSMVAQTMHASAERLQASCTSFRIAPRQR